MRRWGGGGARAHGSWAPAAKGIWPSGRFLVLVVIFNLSPPHELLPLPSSRLRKRCSCLLLRPAPPEPQERAATKVCTHLPCSLSRRQAQHVHQALVVLHAQLHDVLHGHASEYLLDAADEDATELWEEAEGAERVQRAEAPPAVRSGKRWRKRWGLAATRTEGIWARR